MKRGIHTTRTIVSSALLATGILILPASGVLMHLAGHSHGLRETVLGLTRGGWVHLHVLAGFLFTIAAALHLRLNWKMYCNSIRARAK
ncbi:MAG: DUF4405 domain-containing protein [Spirochaetes bacterium]|nr:DUF4405 domain-containing protein [Spirochaetota bacterium]